MIPTRGEEIVRFVRADGVFSGGGIKGLAFAGGLQAGAEAGYDDWSKPPNSRKPQHACLSRWPVDMLKAIVDTSMNALDSLEMIAFAPRTISIPTGDIPTLEFSLTDAQKKELYDSGYNAAKTFFDKRPTGVNTFGAVPASLAPPTGGIAGP